MDPRNNAKTRYGLASAYYGGPKTLALGLFPAYLAGTPVVMTNVDAALPDMVLDPLVVVAPGTSITTPFGTPVTLHATFLGQNLTGGATVLVDGVPHAVTVVDGEVLFATDPTLTVGTHVVMISYGGDPKNIAQQSDKITLVVS